MTRDVKQGLLVLGLVFGVILLATWAKCDDGHLDDIVLDSILDRIEPIFAKPSWWTHLEVDAKPIATIRYKTVPPTAHISGGTIYPSGDIELEFQLDSTLFALHRFEIGGYHGRGTIWIDSLGYPRISYPRWGLDLAAVFGPSMRGATCAIEHVYINNCLGITHVHPLTPLADVEIWQDTSGEPRDIYLGIGATADLAPRHSQALRVGIGWQWSVVRNDNGPTIFVGVALP